MTATTHGSRASNHLNLLRGLAAVAVLVYHVRYRFFLDWADVREPGLVEQLFYTLTAFGHDAVMAFFVLSGYFIASSVMRDCETGRWSWRRYAVNRWTRLYVVLLPGLFLTVFWDTIGLRLFAENPIYTGAAQPWRNDLFPVADRLDVATFFSNGAFLQAIVTPPLGSNEPLWSLSYEFWYYFLFPLAWVAVVGAKASGRLVYAAAFVAILALVGKSLALYFPVWLLGAVVARLPRLPALERHPRVAVWFAAAFFLAILVLSHVRSVRNVFGGSLLAADYAVGVSCAVLVYVLLHDARHGTPGVYTQVADELAGFSYTLYVCHMPLLVFLRAALIPGSPWSPDPLHLTWAILLTTSALGYALLLARLTEARTADVRNLLFSRSPRRTGQPTEILRVEVIAPLPPPTPVP